MTAVAALGRHGWQDSQTRHVSRRRDLPASHDTTEVRWFTDGAPPADLCTWFRSSIAASEERCDRYLLDQVADVGVKQRGGRILELKLRGAVGPSIDLGPGLRGSVEEWSKWSPADDVIAIPEHGRWVSVKKSISKRRFAVAGAELPMAAEPVAGCDVEVTHVIVGDVQAWTLACAAFGPRTTRRSSLDAAWRTLTTSGPVPTPIVHRLGGSMGYPQWLHQTIPAGSAPSVPARTASKESAT